MYVIVFARKVSLSERTHKRGERKCARMTGGGQAGKKRRRRVTETQPDPFMTTPTFLSVYQEGNEYTQVFLRGFLFKQ